MRLLVFRFLPVIAFFNYFFHCLCLLGRLSFLDWWNLLLAGGIAVAERS